MDQKQFEEVLQFVRSGQVYSPSTARTDEEQNHWQERLREAVQSGLMQTFGEWLFPDFAPEWFVAEVCDGNSYDAQGLQQNPGTLSGDLRLLENREWVRFSDSGTIVSPFSTTTLLVPGANEISFSAESSHGSTLVQIQLRVEDGLSLSEFKQKSQTLSLYCASEDPRVLDDFRTLARSEWTYEGVPVAPWLGVRSPVTAAQSIRSPICRMLGQLQPPVAERFLQIPLDACPDQTSDMLTFTVDVGEMAARLLTTLQGCVRRNCVLMWNAALGGVDDPVVTENQCLSFDPWPLQPANHPITILECYDRERQLNWADQRVAGDWDPAFTFNWEASASGKQQMRFSHDVTDIPWRILYLVGQATLPELHPESSWLHSDVEKMVVCSGVSRQPTAYGQMLHHPPQGRVGTRAELLSCLWKILPHPLRTLIDETALEQQEWNAVAIQTELQVAPDENDKLKRKALPTTVVSFPAKCETKALQRAYFHWQQRIARELEQYCDFDQRLELRFEPNTTTEE